MDDYSAYTSSQLLSRLTSFLKADQILTGDMLKERYHHIWQMDEGLKALCLLLPNNTEEISFILKICHDYHQPVVVHGGLTNLVGGTESSTADVCISLERLNKVEEIDSDSMTATVGAGVILEELQNQLNHLNLLFPLNFGARGSAQIGGIISSNAGGLRVVKYGMTRELVLGIEAVCANGSIVSSLKKIIKDNSGYDLKQLFIGSEGTLGIVTRAVLKLCHKPAARSAAFMALDSYSDVLRALEFVRINMGEGLSGFELIWNNTYRKMIQSPSISKIPLTGEHRFYVLMETVRSSREADQINSFENVLEHLLENNIIQDATPAHTELEIDNFFKIREDVNVLTDDMDYDQHFDISLPIPEIGNYIDRVLENLNQLDEVSDSFAFGHVADGNIHIMVDKTNDSDQLRLQINDIVYHGIEDLKGSVSAEHGIGLHKKRYLDLSKTPAEIELMKIIKSSMDPHNILNRGKIL
ncbi:MAG: FAD-binding oxidoreductase [Nonlabens sp.]